jgi:hypothetical protein
MLLLAWFCMVCQWVPAPVSLSMPRALRCGLSADRPCSGMRPGVARLAMHSRLATWRPGGLEARSAVHPPLALQHPPFLVHSSAIPVIYPVPTCSFLNSRPLFEGQTPRPPRHLAVRPPPHLGHTAMRTARRSESLLPVFSSSSFSFPMCGMPNPHNPPLLTPDSPRRPRRAHSPPDPDPSHALLTSAPITTRPRPHLPRHVAAHFSPSLLNAQLRSKPTLRSSANRI